MNSFNTHDDTHKVLLFHCGSHFFTSIFLLFFLADCFCHIQIVEKYTNSNVDIHTFNQVCDVDAYQIRKRKFHLYVKTDIRSATTNVYLDIK